MANPQKENGYVAIATEIMEALSRTRIPGEVRQIVDTTIRKTYGFNKKHDAISLSQFCISTGMRKCDVCRAINKAVSMNIVKIISKKANGIGNIYSINKDFDTWKPLAKKQRGVAKKQMTICKKANNRLQKSNIQKTVTKDTITKDISEQSSQLVISENKDIATVIDAFKVVNPAYSKWFANTTQRSACARLIKAHGLEKVLSFITFIEKTNGKPYAPTIATPLQLEDKLPSLKAWAERKTAPSREIIRV